MMEICKNMKRGYVKGCNMKKGKEFKKKEKIHYRENGGVGATAAEALSCTTDHYHSPL